MTTNKNNKRKPNAARKLIPAIGMLTASAMMLASSTYAWFTMSREVEVNNIQMTATVPEDIQISLGRIGTSSTVAETSKGGKSLAGSTGVLVKKSNASNANDGNVEAPRNNVANADAIDWANTADISAYYSLGRLIPASSTTGAQIYFTPDANGIGQTVKTDAKYYQATNGLVAVPENTTNIGASDSEDTLKATLYAFTDDSNRTWTNNGTRATSWNATHDDGYYVDIPVWLRTSSTAGANVSVKAYVTPRNSLPTTDDKLYKAVRVAILPADGDSTVTATNLIPVTDGWDTTNDRVSDTPYAFDSSDTEKMGILDWYNRAGDTNHSGNAVASITAQATTTPTYGTASKYTPGATVAALAAGGGNSYGTASNLIIRVWLEGEDPDCWNETAGQDWNICLKFNNETTNASGSSDSKVSINYASKENDTYTFDLPGNENDVVFTYGESGFTANKSALPANTEGKSWSIDGTTVIAFNDLATYISTHAPTGSTMVVSVKEITTPTNG